MNAQTLRCAGLAGILGVAAMRALVSIAPRVWFDVDPASDPMPLLSLDAVGSHVFDLALLMSAALALIGEYMSGRGVRLGLVLLALIPVPVLVYHAHFAADGDDAFRGDTWLAAIVGFTALAHLVRDRSMRVIALSVFLSLLMVLAVRGFVQVWVEHPATVALYNETKAAFLADRGWAADSSAALTYERRLMQAEATGWFGLSNPFSTMMGVGVVGITSLAWLARRGQQGGNTLLLALGALACAVLLVLNGGKGALGATAIGAVLLWCGLLMQRQFSTRWVLVASACVIAAVLVRGAVGTRVGELSLLMRAFYLEAGVNLMRDGSTILVGTGPDGVQELFNAAKPSECPEDVKSLHSMGADWVVTLGVSGLAWIALICAAFWRSDVQAPSQPTCEGDGSSDASEANQVVRFAVTCALGIGVLATLLQALIEAPVVDPFWLLCRGVGVVLFVLFASLIARACACVSERTITLIALAAAAVVLTHSMIETVAWMPSSCVLALCVIAVGTTVKRHGWSEGAAVDGGVLGAAVHRGAPWLTAVFALAAVVSVCASLATAVRTAAAMSAVAQTLTPFASSSDSAAVAVDERAAAEFEARLAAARALTAADAPRSAAAMDAAVEQALSAAARSPARARGALELAWILTQPQNHDDARVVKLRGEVALSRLRLADNTLDDVEQSLQAIEHAVAASPKNPRRQLEFARACEVWIDRVNSAGAQATVSTDLRNRRDPRAAYERALEVNRAMHLDPLAQLSAREEEFVLQALKRLTLERPRP